MWVGSGMEGAEQLGVHLLIYYFTRYALCAMLHAFLGIPGQSKTDAALSGVRVVPAAIR